MPVNPHAPRNNPLARAMAADIAAAGPMPVATYMARAAEAYYAQQQPFGREGDFITAPGISQMFGEMIAAWLADIWFQYGCPSDVKLIELGPGMGTLSADILRTITAWPDFKKAVTLHLVETSDRLIVAQKSILSGENVIWHKSINEVPRGFSLVVANEFFDALPVHQYIKQNGAWHERMVGYDPDADRFFFTTSGAGETGCALAPEGSIFETSPVSHVIVETLARRINDDGGAALIIDYGHRQSGFGDTLQALYRHESVDVLEDPGGRDVTAHVDFATLGAFARRHAAVTPVSTQGYFLSALGIAVRAARLCDKATAAQRAEIMSALARLTTSAQMGTLFKVMAITPKAAIITPAGFEAARQDEVS